MRTKEVLGNMGVALAFYSEQVLCKIHVTHRDEFGELDHGGLCSAE